MIIMLLLIHAYVNIVDKAKIMDSPKMHFHIMITSRFVACTNRNMVVNCLSIDYYDNIVITYPCLS